VVGCLEEGDLYSRGSTAYKRADVSSKVTWQQ
jgi:hypothetical protein